MKENNFKIGDKVRIRTSVTLEEIKANHFNGCQRSTMNFLLEQSSGINNFNNTFEIEYNYDKYITLKNIDGALNPVIFEKIGEPSIIKTPQDLKFGDIVTLRNSERYVIANDTMYGELERYYQDCEPVCNYNDNLKYYENSDREDDIVKVERAGTTIFEREESKVKEMTIEEISKALGHGVKVVK